MSYVEEVFDLKGRVVIITGGAGLIGSQYSIALTSAGADVVIADIDCEAGATAAARASAGEGGNATFIETDVSDKGSVQAMVARTMAQYDKVDGLVNNCAIDPKFDRESANEHQDSFEDFPIDVWERSLKVNLTGMFLCAQAVSRPMLASGGAIVNVSSMYGMVGPDQRLYHDPEATEQSYKPVTYSVSKSAVFGLTRYLATYWAGKNIRVNTLTLGGVYNNHPPAFTSRYGSRTPLGRMANDNEYCGALLFLLSDASSYMTGSNLVVDGGWTAW